MLSRFMRGFCAVSGLPVLLVWASSSLLGCKKTPEPTGTGVQLAPSVKAVESAPAPAASTAPPVEITWLDPPGLKRVAPKSAMRKASYEVPHVATDTEDGDLAVFYFGPGQGGSIDANVDRWVKQFTGVAPGDVKRADREANGLHQHTVEITNGTFDAGSMSMAAATPKKDYALQGAIVEAPSGAYFFKMTGPAKTIAAARTAFLQLLDSVRVGG